jgi:hypothetical protein
MNLVTNNNVMYHLWWHIPSRECANIAHFNCFVSITKLKRPSEQAHVSLFWATKWVRHENNDIKNEHYDIIYGARDVTGRMAREVLRMLRAKWCHAANTWCQQNVPRLLRCCLPRGRYYDESKKVTGYWAWAGLVNLHVTNVWNVTDDRVIFGPTKTLRMDLWHEVYKKIAKYTANDYAWHSYSGPRRFENVMYHWISCSNYCPHHVDREILPWWRILSKH